MENAHDIIAWMVITMMADGQVEAGEKELIRKYAQLHKISPAYVNNLADAAGSRTLAAPIPQSQEEAKSWIREMLGMAMADGEATRRELVAVKNLAVSVEMDNEQLKALIAEIRENITTPGKKSCDNLDDLTRQIRERSPG